MLLATKTDMIDMSLIVIGLTCQMIKKAKTIGNEMTARLILRSCLDTSINNAREKNKSQSISILIGNNLKSTNSPKDQEYSV